MHVFWGLCYCFLRNRFYKEGCKVKRNAHVFKIYKKKKKQIEYIKRIDQDFQMVGGGSLRAS